MALDPKRLGGLLQGLGRLLQDDEARAELIGKVEALARKAGKAAALELLDKSGAGADAIRAAKEELDRKFPDG